MSVVYEPVGVVRSPHTELEGTPRQSVAVTEARGEVEVWPEYEPGLSDLDGFSHLFLICHLHAGAPGGLMVVPALDDTPRGVFATRSPRHPNPIGLSIVRLLGVEGPILHVAGLDVLDGTPVLDIKPYVPAVDAVDADRTGWLENVDPGQPPASAAP